MFFVVLACGMVGCKGSIESVANGIAPGTPISEVESRFGKADQVINAQARKGKSANKMYVYKRLDEEFDLWVNFGPDGKVIWATPQSKAAKVNTG